MRQQTLAVAAEGSFEKYRKATQREVFLAEMNRIVPWGRLVALVEPSYPKAGNGRRPVGVERMLRLYFLQQQRRQRPQPRESPCLQHRNHILRMGGGNHPDNMKRLTRFEFHCTDELAEEDFFGLVFLQNDEVLPELCVA